MKKKLWKYMGVVFKWMALPYMAWFEVEYNAIIVGLPRAHFDVTEAKHIDFEGSFDEMITTDIPPREDMN